MKLDDEKAKLFNQVRILCGAPVRMVEIDDDVMCTLLDTCVSDYASIVQNWVIRNQWMTLYGKDFNSIDMSFALSVRTFDMAEDYSQWFSKKVGLQQNGKWELKKDFITIEAGKQSYIIPAGREINKVLYTTPPTSQAALFANYAGIDIGFGGGYAQIGSAWSTGGPLGGFYTMPAYDTFLLASDMNLKNRLLRSDLTYKVTAMADGRKILHLMSTPGSKLSFGYVGGVGGGLSLVGCQVWYTYYDVTPENVDECRKDNKGVLLTPDQVPLEHMDYAYMNTATKATIRQLLVAAAKGYIGLVRGTYSGKVAINMAELMLDYNMFNDQARSERQAVIDDLQKRLESMNPVNLMREQAEMMEAQNKLLTNVPLPIMVI